MEVLVAGTGGSWSRCTHIQRAGIKDWWYSLLFPFSSVQQWKESSHLNQSNVENLLCICPDTWLPEDARSCWLDNQHNLTQVFNIMLQKGTWKSNSISKTGFQFPHQTTQKEHLMFRPAFWVASHPAFLVIYSYRRKEVQTRYILWCLSSVQLGFFYINSIF